MEEETCEYTGMDIYNCQHIIESEAQLLGMDTQLKKYKENIFELQQQLTTLTAENARLQGRVEGMREVVEKIKRNINNEEYSYESRVGGVRLWIESTELKSLLTSPNPEVVAVPLKDLRIIIENASMDGNEEEWAAWDRVKAIAQEEKP